MIYDISSVQSCVCPPWQFPLPTHQSVWCEYIALSDNKQMTLLQPDIQIQKYKFN